MMIVIGAVSASFAIQFSGPVPVRDGGTVAQHSAAAQSPSQHLNPDQQQSSRPVARLSLEGITALQESGETANQGDLTEEEKSAVQELKKLDREVRAHEQAHKAAGGPYASAPSYEYEVGPDQQRYAVAGEVKIDSAPIPGDPEATITKLEIVIRAALAPAEPSAQDYKVAATARQNIQQAQAELQAKKTEERRALLEGDRPENERENGTTADDQVAELVSTAIA